MWRTMMAVDIESQLKEGTDNIPRGEFKLTTVLNSVYALMGLVAVVTIVYNAIAYLSSQGDPSKAKKATQGLVFAGLGLAIVLLATVITNFIFVTIGEAE